MKSSSRLTPAADFASTAMVRVLVQGMRDLGLNLEPVLTGSADHLATVSLDKKRQLVSSALAQGGIGCLARLGRGLHRFAHEPTYNALVSTRDAQDLFARWARLGGYIHSRHRIEVLELSDRSARIAHLSCPGSPPPLPAEDLVVLGVLAALLEAIGAATVTAWIGEVPVYPNPDVAALGTVVEHRGTAAWSVEWAPMTALPCRQRTCAVETPEFHAPPAWPTHGSTQLHHTLRGPDEPLDIARSGTGSRRSAAQLAAQIESGRVQLHPLAG